MMSRVVIVEGSIVGVGAAIMVTMDAASEVVDTEREGDAVDALLSGLDSSLISGRTTTMCFSGVMGGSGMGGRTLAR